MFIILGRNVITLSGIGLTYIDLLEPHQSREKSSTIQSRIN